MSTQNTNYKISTGQDLNLIFAPLDGTAGPNTGFKYYDILTLTYKDINQLFEPYSGGDTANTTNYISYLSPHNGKDLNIIFNPIASAVWSYINYNNRNTRQSIYDGPPPTPSPPATKWQYSAPVGANFNENQLVIGPTGIIYIAENNGFIYALLDNATSASVLFSSNTSYSGLKSPTIGVNNIMYVVGPDTIRAYKDINTTSPSILWSLSIIPATNPNSPIIGSDGTLYVSTSDGFIYAVSSNGILKWSYDLFNPVSKIAIGINGTIYACASTYLYAINSNGTLKWSYDATVILEVPSIGADGTIYAINLSSIYAITDTGTTGILKWNLDVGTDLRGIVSIGSNGKLYLVTDQTVISVIDNVTNGSIYWNCLVSVDAAELTEVSIGLDGTIYTTGDYGLVASITEISSSPFYQINWAYQVTLSGSSSPCTIGSNGTIYFGGDHNYILALN